MSLRDVPSSRYGSDGLEKSGLYCCDKWRFIWINAPHAALASSSRMAGAEDFWTFSHARDFHCYPSLFLAGGGE